ncbi:MAG: hypothetical protein RR945_11335, partial [Erysipelotrichaceae bacterium]
DHVSNKVTSFVDGVGGNRVSKKSGGSKSSKPPVKKVKVEAKCPEKAKSSSNGALDTLQDVLDWIGWIPGIGDICDGINAVISFLRGMFLACAISVACLALPVIADAIFKPLKKIVSSVSTFAQKTIEGLSKAGHKPSKIINGIVDFCNGIKSFVKGCWAIPGNIKTKVAGWIDNTKGYVSDIFNKAKNALSPKLATNTGAEFSENSIKHNAIEITTNGVVSNATKRLNILSKFRSKKIKFGNNELLLDKNGMDHILSRHHLDYWDGTIKAKQSFFEKGTQISEIENAIDAVARQNKDLITEKGTNAIFQITGLYNGKSYTLGLNNGKVGQFFPN